MLSAAKRKSSQHLHLTRSSVSASSAAAENDTDSAAPKERKKKASGHHQGTKAKGNLQGEREKNSMNKAWVIVHSHKRMSLIISPVGSKLGSQARDHVAVLGGVLMLGPGEAPDALLWLAISFSSHT